MGMEFAHQAYNMDLIDFVLIKPTSTKALYVLFPENNIFLFICNPSKVFASLKSKWGFLIICF